MDRDNEPLLAPQRHGASSAGAVPLSPRSVSTQQLPTELAILSPNFRPPWKTRVSFILVLLTETLERTAFYGIVCNMVLFLNSDPMQWTSYNAVDAILVLNGISYVMAIFGGWIADSGLGKFWAILFAYVVYIGGFAFWPMFYPYPFDKYDKKVPDWCSHSNGTKNLEVKLLEYVAGKRYARSVNDETTATPVTDRPYMSWTSENCAWAVYLSIAIISVGYGTVRANIIPFGAQQFEHEGRTAVRVYFNWFYWCINIGALVSYGALGYVQQELSYFWGYIAPLAVLVVALLAFVSGSCVYVKRSATGSVLTNIVRVCGQSLRLCCSRSHSTDTLNAEIRARSEPPPRGCLDYARMRHGGSCSDTDVDDIRQLGKIVVVFLAMVPYWTAYYQMQTTFVVQSFHMQLDFDNNDTMAAAAARKFTIPAAWLSLFNVLFVLLLLPVLDRLIYPALDRSGHSPSLKARITIGMGFAVAAILCAGVTEHYRLATYWEGGHNHTHYQKIGNTYYLAAKMTVFYQLPQYALIGISELFASIGGLELAYIYAPRSMQGIIMGLYWFSQGLGSWLGTGLLAAFESTWFTTYDYGNINCAHSPFTDSQSHCHLDYYFYFLSGVLVIGIIMFTVVTWAVEIGAKVPLRVLEEGVTVVRPSGGGEEGLEGSRANADGRGSAVGRNYSRLDSDI